MAKIDEAKRLLLIRNSTLHGNGYLDHVEKEILDFVGRRTTVLVPTRSMTAGRHKKKSPSSTVQAWRCKTLLPRSSYTKKPNGKDPVFG